MQCSAADQESTSSDEEIHEAIDTILAEDKREKLARKRKLAEREAAAAAKESEERDRSKRRNPSAECKKRHIGVEKSRRFSLRVMEAMRAIERRKERRSECPAVSVKSSTTCEIVNYIDRNFRNDGDVDAQVRIALKRLACQGFVKCEGNDAYALLGPFAVNSRLGKAGKANFSHSTPDLTNCQQRNSSRRNAPRSNRSTPRCNRGCRRDRSCNQTEESSEIDLSIPSSVEEDMFRRRIERDIESLQQRCPLQNETEAENATMDVSCERRLRNPAQGNETARRNSEIHFEAANSLACGDEDYRRQGKCLLNRSVTGSPRRRSPAREDDRIVGAIHDPTREIEAAIGLPEFADDGNDDYEPIDVPRDEDADQLDEDDQLDEADDEVEDDNVLQELRQNGDGQMPMDEDRDRELKRWIRNCRRECERRAREGHDRGDQDQV